MTCCRRTNVTHIIRAIVESSLACHLAHHFLILSFQIFVLILGFRAIFFQRLLSNNHLPIRHHLNPYGYISSGGGFGWLSIVKPPKAMLSGNGLIG